MKVKVLQHHIDEGMRGNAAYCPIARALKDELGIEQNSPHDVAVGRRILVRAHDGLTIFESLNDYVGRSYLPTDSELMERFILQFDSWGGPGVAPVEPIELDFPDL